MRIPRDGSLVFPALAAIILHGVAAFLPSAPLNAPVIPSKRAPIDLTFVLAERHRPAPSALSDIRRERPQKKTLKAMPKKKLLQKKESSPTVAPSKLQSSAETKEIPPAPRSAAPEEIRPAPASIATEDHASVEMIREERREAFDPAPAMEAPSIEPTAQPEAFPAVEADSGPAIVPAAPAYASNPPPSYPYLARKRGYEGRVMLEVMVCADGTAAEVRVKESSGHEILDRAALESVQQWKFEPGREGRRPVDMRVDVPVRFALKGRSR